MPTGIYHHKSSWNKDLKLSENPKYKKMGFQKGHGYMGGTLGKKWKVTDTFNMRGEKHWRWIKDRDFAIKNERNDGEYKQWVRACKKRDNWKCRIDNQDCRGYCEVHHILRWSDYQDLHYNINNGITLCQFHHPKRELDEKRLIPFFQSMVEVINK